MAYDLPTPATLRQVYPAFADAQAIPDATIQFWLDRVVGKDVDQSWPSFGADAQMAAAAHRMIRAPIPGLANTETGAIAALVAAGVTDFQSGGREGFRASLSPDAIKQAIAGGWASTGPGLDYWELLQMKAAGPRVTAPGVIPCGNFGFNGFAGPLPNGGLGYGWGG